jgi:hypothetical protein
MSYTARAGLGGVFEALTNNLNLLSLSSKKHIISLQFEGSTIASFKGRVQNKTSKRLLS